VSRSNFEKLRVYRLAERLGQTVWKTTMRWDSFNQSTLGRQLLRAADSIGANIAEGAGRGSFADNRRFVRIARGSLYETKHWLRCAFQRQLLSTPEINELREIVDSLAPQLNAYLKTIGPKD
jgi:four helix bundle protein